MSCSPIPWIVYVGSSRFPYVQSVTPLPQKVACCFTRLSITWDMDLDFPGYFSCVVSAILAGSGAVSHDGFLIQLLPASQPHDSTMSPNLSDAAAIRDGRMKVNAGIGSNTPAEATRDYKRIRYSEDIYPTPRTVRAIDSPFSYVNKVKLLLH